jgi:glycopeptide antibiotics resistance protein
MVKEFLLLGIAGALFLCVVAASGYFLVYKKLFKGSKRITAKDILHIVVVFIYVIMVIGVTFLTRPIGSQSGMNLHLFSSYREAWNTFSLRNWQFVIFNIVMFIPLGMILPFFYNKFRKAYMTVGLGIVFTIFIEMAQLKTLSGIFELDDIFNNTLGTLIGYCVIMTFLILTKERSNKFKKTVIYIVPILIVLITFGGIYTKYNLNEFGNLKEAYIYKFDLKDTEISVDVDLSRDSNILAIYKAPVLDRESADDYAEGFFENIGLEAEGMEIDAYDDDVIYKINESDDYSLWIDYIGGTYNYSDFSRFNKEAEESECEEIRLVDILNSYGIEIPEAAVMEYLKEGQYCWKMDKVIDGNSIIDGTITCWYYDDDTIKSIGNNLITYEMVREVEVINEREALDRLLEGEFRMWTKEDSIKSLTVKNVSLDYRIDTKGFYQPVYLFETVVNGNEFKIVIPALVSV